MPEFKRARYQQLLDAGLTALRQREYEEIKVSEVADTAGLARATLYNYFISKEHLYAVIFRQWTETEPQRLSTPSESGAERARTRVDAIVSAVERHPQFHKLSITLSASTEAEVQAELSATGARMRRLFAADFAAFGVPSPQDAAAMLQALINSLLTGAVHQRIPFSEVYRLTTGFIDLYDPRNAGTVDRSPHQEHPEPVPAPAPRTDKAMPPAQLQRRDRIVAAALDALREQPYEQIHVTDIAQRAQVALGTFYRYFPSKELLYAFALQKWSLSGRFLLPLPHLDAETRIRARTNAAIDAFETDLQFFKTTNLLYSAKDKEVQTVLTEMTHTGKAVFLEDFSTLGTENPEDAASMLWAIINSLAISVIHHNGSFPETRRIASEFISLVTNSTHRDRPRD
ncbi:TetR/AcrR family transcriptional regulator [Actinocorallia libanotica]|uniref:HTH tetR-type domain-containing protein n=1 Tax=Actinocorallia libanotica TaxID=46162 RepID=A0ABP4B1R1_9ACTN